MKINYLMYSRNRNYIRLKIIKIMRLTVLLLLVGIFQVYAGSSYSRAASLSTAPEGTTVKNVLSELVDVYLQPQEVVTGKVVDADGNPLPGVNIVLKGTMTGTITNAEGNYTINVDIPDAVLVFSFIGYTTQEVEVGGRAAIDVTLALEVVGLEEVIAVGYGTQKRTTVTGAVSIMKGETIEKTPVPNISHSLAGNMAGVVMRPTGYVPGDDDPDIYIRGVATTGENAPLVVVDGIMRNNINQIDPASIESMSILKDASAVAPYGLGGANGVILITTKKGQAGAPTLTFNTYYGIQNPTYLPNTLDAVDFMKMHNECYLNENPGAEATKPYKDATVNNYASLHASDPDLYPDSDWRNIMNWNVPMQKYNLSLRGGSDTYNYYAGLGYFRQDGMYDPVNYNRYNYNVNLGTQATNTTNVSVSLIGSIEITNDTDPNESTEKFFRSNFKYKPLAQIWYTNGLWGQFAGNSPIGFLKAGYSKNRGNTLLSMITIEQQLPFIKGLSVKGTFSYDVRTNAIKQWHTPFYFYAQDTNTDPYTYTKDISTGEGHAATYTWLRQEQQKRQYYTYQGYVNYANSFGKHDITGLFVAEARNNTYDNFWARREQFAIDVDEISMGSSDKDDFDNGGLSSEGAQIGYVYRLGYVYDDKYLLEVSGRYDGHYYFAPGERWAFFPAFSVGWRLSEENFIQNIPFINNLKVRASWGKSGNLAGAAYQYLSGYELRGNAYSFGTGTMVQGARVDLEANPNITWEIATKTDIGFDITLWNYLLTVEADYYFEKREGMLIPPAVTVPLEYGLDLADENEGIMDSYGIELTVGSRYRFDNGMQFALNGNFSYAKNEMKQVFETDATYNNPNRRRTGRPYNTPFGYKSLGLFQESDDVNGDGVIDSSDGYNVTQFGTLHPGDIKYEDLSGPDGVPDGKIDSNDETVAGYPVYPRITYGFTPTLAYKGFDLSLFFQGTALVSLWIQGFQTVPFNNNDANTDYEYFDDHWTPQTPDATYPRANSSPYANNTAGSDFWYMNTGFLRLKTATLGYTLPATVMDFLKIQSVRLYLTGQNILTFSKLKFMDPEASYTGREQAWPNQYSVTFGLDVTF
jgi:TonB-linked SusC/RagA family outer membrane protein